MSDDRDISRGLAAFEMIQQVRKALNDIQESFTTGKPHRAEYQLYLLRTMVDEQPSRRKPWSAYRPMISEEFDE